MKQRLLLRMLILFSISVYSQVQGPPPPCGLFPAYACDDNGDGFTSFNLIEAFPFETFCRIDKGDPEDYYSIVYYTTIEDMNNETNPIANPESFINSSNPQKIYYRANKIVPNQSITYLGAENTIELTNILAKSLKLEVYDNDSDGLSVFDLTSLDLFCGSINENDYSITYHTSQSGVEDGTNTISNPSSFSNTSNGQIISVRALNNNTGEVEITTIWLSVLFAEANNPGNINICDDDYDGIYTFNLASQDFKILGNQNSNNFTVSYFLTQTDAENKINQLASIYNTSNSVTIFARVDENASGSYEITSFSVSIFIPPIVSSLDPYEVCDDDGDGKVVFDLYTIMNQINNGENNYDISFYTDKDDEYGSSIVGSYTNIVNPQTIYVDVEDMEGYGCFTILPLQLIVQDCSAKGVIEINSFYDVDNDTSFDNDEINFLNGLLTYEKNKDGIQHSMYSSNGVFNIISEDENDTYDISYDILDEYSSCYNVTTTSYEDINVTNGNTVNYNFPITKIQDCGDIAVYLVSYASPRPGFDYYNRLVIINKGLETVTSGSIEFTHDPIVTFNNVSYVDTGDTGDTGNSITNTSTGFIIDFVNLEPNQSESVIIRMNVPIPTSLGTLLTNTATYAVADLSIENNTSILSETVIGSYDPNDIAESKGPEILYAEFSSTDYLYYTVRFQNVGTADAINVSIDNTLDSRLDKSTIQMLSSSHTNVFTRVEDQLNWKFDDIHLPSEDMDEPSSHGYVYYKIKPLVGYKVGDIIPNTAEIYFDFNDPVITNTFETEFITTLSNSKFNNTGFSIYPNPAKNIIELKFSRTINNIINTSIYNIQGKLILDSKNNIQNSEIQLNVSSLKSGIYFLKVNDGISKITQKLIIE
ncbi:MAG: T9SS type A sorting domain-containing protein [Algibacter sp.]